MPCDRIAGRQQRQSNERMTMVGRITAIRVAQEHLSVVQFLVVFDVAIAHRNPFLIF